MALTSLTSLPSSEKEGSLEKSLYDIRVGRGVLANG